MNRATRLLAAMTIALVIICAGWVPGQDFSLGIASAATRVDDPNANGANGSTAKPYIINEPGDFEWILSNWNLAGSSELMQTRDIDLTGYAWTPLDGPWSGFRGKYDGNGHTISNLLIDDSTKMYVGLFGRVEGDALVKNVTLVNANVTGRLPSAYIGGIVGMHNGGTIERCRVSGSVTGGNNDSVGGIAGYSGATIRYCSNSAAGRTGADAGGGNQPRVGGIVGMCSGTVHDSYNIGNVTGGASSCVGGIVGFGYAGTFQSCYNTGVVTGSGISTGSIIGQIRTTAGVSSNYYLTGTAAAGIGHVDPSDWSGNTASNVGTTALSAVQMQSSGNYSWTFTGSTWTIQPGVNNSYPTLKGVPTLAVTAPVSGLTITTATSGGEVTAAGLGTVSERGIERTKSTESTYTKAVSGSGTGSFTAQVSGLDHSTSYYARSYATNEVGTAYGEPVTFTTKSLVSVTLSPGTEIGMTKATPAAAATSKFVVNITDASVGRVDADTLAPTSGASLVDNYLSGADLSLGVQIGRYLQIYDVDGAGLIKNYAEVRLEVQHIKQPPLLNVSVTPGDAVGSTKATITGAAISRFVLNISDSSFGQIAANQTAPTSGEYLIANYASGTAISSGVLKGRYLQIFDVDASNVIKGFCEVVLQAVHIKQPPFSLPYHEPFGDSTLPSTLQWQEIVSGGLDWSVVQTGSCGEQTRSMDGYMAMADSYWADAGAKARLSLSSSFAIPLNVTRAEFSFWMCHANSTIWGECSDTIQPQISLDGGISWTNLGAEILNTVALSDPGRDFEWTQHTLDLSGYAGNANVRVGLLAVSGYGYDLLVDDLDIAVEAPIVEYALTYTAGANGTLTGSTSQTVQEGSDGTQVVAVPNAGYHFVSWSDGVATAARTDRGVSGAVNVTANFAANIAITVTANPQSKVYGAVDPALTYSLTSGALELGDSFSGALSREAGEGVGSYAIGKGTLSAGPKYDVTFVNSSLTITKRSIEVTANSLAKTYGGSDPALTYGITQGSLVPGDEITGSLTRAAGEGVGSYQVGQGSLAVSPNYELSFIPGTFTINPAALTVTAGDESKTYGNANPDFTVSYSGFVLGQDPSALGGALTLTTSANVSSGAGAYPITPSGLTSSNYAITFVDGTLTVNPASLTVTAGDESKTYGSANPGFTASYSGFVLGQDPSVLGGALVFVTSANSTSGVGTYVITPSGLTSSNYTITFVNGTLTVNAASLTVTADDKSKPYGSANPAFTATYSGLVLGQDPSVLSGALVFATPAVGSSGVGTYAISPFGLTSSNYAITFVDGTLTVNLASLTVTADDKSKTYGSANPSFTVSYSGFALGQDPSALGGALTLATSATVSSGTGAYPIIPSGLTSSNYAITFVDGTLQVNPAALTVTAEDKSRVYGGVNPVFTATYSGFVLGQDASVLGGALSFTTPAVAGSDVGAYDITPSGLTSSNYAITFVDGALTVTPAALTVSADNKSKTYGQPNPAFTASYTGFAVGDGPSALGGALTFTTPAVSSSVVGSYPVTPSGLTSSNYAITFVGGTLQVNPVALTVTADDKAKTYGSANPALTVSYSGFVLGQGPSALGGALVLSTTAAASSDVGAYPVIPSGLTSSNYAITFVDGTLEVTKTALTVTAENKSKSYGSDNPAFTVIYSGFRLGQDPLALGGTLTFSTPAVNSSDVGAYAITPSGLTSSNYAITFVDGTLQVTPVALTVTADNKSRTYGSDNPAFTATYSGLVLGQNPSALSGTLTFTTPAASGSNVGSYSIAPSGLTSSNYSITFVNGTLQVTPAALTVRAEDKVKTYGDANPAFTAAYSGFVLGQNASVLGGSLTFNTLATTSSGVATYAVAPSGLTSGNYAITFVDGTLTVDRATLTVTADNKSKTYGSDNPAFTASYSGFVLGQNASVLGGTLTFTTSATTSSDVNAYTVTPSGLTSSNYAITFVDGTLAVNRAALTVTAENKSKTYGSDNPAFTAAYSGFVLGQDPSVLGGTLTFTTPAANDSNVGSYAITPSGLTSSNYAISFGNGTLQVTPAALTVRAENKAKTYGDANPAFTVAYSGFVLGQGPAVLGGALTFTTPATASSGVGTYAINPSGLTSSNYAITFAGGQLQVNQAPLIVEAEDKIRAYGEADPAFTVTYSGFVLGQTQAVLGGTLTLNTEATVSSGVGIYSITPSGLTSSNYAITFVDGVLQVEPALLTVTADTKSKVYGEADPVLTYRVTAGGLVNGDSFTGKIVRAPGENVGDYAITQGTLSAGGNYLMTYVPGELAISKRPLTVAADAKSKVYGESDPAFSLQVTAGSLVNGDAFSGELGRVAGTVVGDYQIRQGSLTAGANYAITYVPADLTITQKPINATGIGASDRVYDGGVVANLVLDGAGLDGVVIGDTVTLSTAGASGAFADKNVAVGKAVTVSGLMLSGVDAGNYALLPYTTTASVTKKAVYAIDIIALDKVYDGRTEADLDRAAAGLSGVVSGDDLTLVTDGAVGAFAEKNVAAAKMVTVTGLALSGVDAANYALQPYTTSAAITKKAVYATGITAQNKIYDGSANAGLDKAAAGLSGVVSGEDLALVTDSAVGTFADKNVGVGKTVTVAGLTLAGTDVDNYALQIYTTPATITAKPVSAIGIAAIDKVYDRNNVAALDNALAGLNGVVDGDSVALGTVTTGTFDDEHVGSAKAVTVSGLTLAGADAGNYDLQAYGTTATIAPKPVSALGIAAADKVYDSTLAATLDASLAVLDSVVAGDELTLVSTGASGAFEDKNVGANKTVIVTGLALDGADILNYQLLPYSTKADITARPITVTADAKTKVYGEDDPALTYQLTSGVLVGEDAFSGELARALGKSVGEYDILQSGLTAGGNYHLTYVSAKLTITPKSISAAGITATSKYEDGSTEASLSTVNAGLLWVEPGDDVQLDASHASGAFADAGLGVSKPVTVTGLALTGADAGNYQLNPYTTTASIVEEPEPPKPPTPPAGNGDIIVNGEIKGGTATWSTTDEGDKTKTTVVIDQEKLNEQLEEEGENSTVTVPVNTGADVVVGELTGQTVKNMETKSAVLEIKTERVTYTLPASQIRIDNVAAQLGEAVSLQDVKVSVQVAEPPADTVKIVEDTANRNSYQVVVKPVEFTITCTHEEQTVEVSKFNGYVERMVAVPEGIDPAKITTGVVLNADGTFSHVPTTIVMIDGKYFAKINSLTNSVYSVIWNPIEFQDMNGHWAKGPVNDMGSRLVMEGESTEVFGPKKAITRGEFAATIVKALGLRPETGESPFVDLQADHKYYGHILTAYQYHIMGGLPGNKFGADSELTREEAMAIVVSAMRLTELSSTLSAAEVNTTLAAYADSARVGGWARNVVAACLKSGIIGGRPGQLIAPKDIITRAEAASIMQRFLRQAGLI